MDRLVCVYLHGFLSSANSYKARWFVEHLQSVSEQKISLWQVPDYPMDNPEKSVSYLYEQVIAPLKEKDNATVVLVGSSMGGFYAQYFASKENWPCILINPALDPVALFDEYQGEHQNPHRDETVVIDEVYQQALKNYYSQPADMAQSLLLLDEGDEVIPYWPAFELYQSLPELHQVKLFRGGDHAFQHLEESLPALKSFMQRVLQPGG